MLNHRIEEGEGATILHLSGDLTITQGEELRALLTTALVTFDRLVLHLGEVGGVDLPALQILCAAHRTASEQGRALSIDGRDCAPLRETARKGGLARHTGCLCDSTGTCLWLEGGLHG